MEITEFIKKTKNLDKKLDEMFAVVEEQIKEFINAEPDLTYKQMDRILDRIKPFDMSYKAEIKKELLKIIKTYLNEVMHEQKISSVITGINTDEN